MLTESYLYGLFLQESALNIFTLLFLSNILARAGVLEVSLLSEGRVQFVLPEISTHGCAHEWVQVLTSVGAGTEFRITYRRVHGALIACRRGREHVRIVARSWLLVLDLGVFAVGDLGDEDASVDHGVEGFRLLGFLGAIVLTRTRIVSRRILLVLNIDGRLENLARLLRGLEIADGCSLFRVVQVWVVEGRADSVEATTCIHVLIDFLGRDGCGTRLQLVDLFFVLLSQVLLTGLVQVGG